MTRPASINAMQLRYEKSPPQKYPAGHPLESWGEFFRYLEIAQDLYATRHVDAFANGNMLRYDRQRWADEFGSMANALWGEDWAEWWGPSTSITADEFERIWQATERAANYQQQQASRAGEGNPPWLNPNHVNHSVGQVSSKRP